MQTFCEVSLCFALISLINMLFSLADSKKTSHTVLYFFAVAAIMFSGEIMLKTISSEIDYRKYYIWIGEDFRKALHTPYNATNKELEIKKFDKKIDLSNTPTLERLRFLGIMFTNPSKKIHYQPLGFVTSIPDKLKELYDEHGFQFSDVKAMKNEYRFTLGLCNTYYEMDAQSISYTYQVPLDPLGSFFTACHEEMHVAQKYSKQEVNAIFEQKLRKIGRYINLGSCHEEVRCHLAAIVRLLELGMNEKDLPKLLYAREHGAKTLQIFNQSKAGSIYTKMLKLRVRTPSTGIGELLEVSRFAGCGLRISSIL